LTWTYPYKTSKSIDLTNGKQAEIARKANNPIFKINDGGGLLKSKLSAEIPHCIAVKLRVGSEAWMFLIIFVSFVVENHLHNKETRLKGKKEKREKEIKNCLGTEANNYFLQ